MLKINNYEAKTKEEALELSLVDLGLKENEIHYKEEEISGGLFKGKKIKLIVLPKKEIKKYIKDFISTIDKYMNIDIKVEIKEEDKVYNVLLISNDNSILIGKDGRTLHALEVMLRASVQSNSDFDIKINIDAGNYKAKRIERFEREIIKIIKEVVKTKIDVSLDPMNSFQRRIVHNLANKFDKIFTSSDGEGIERHVVIHYKED